MAVTAMWCGPVRPKPPMKERSIYGHARPPARRIPPLGGAAQRARGAPMSSGVQGITETDIANYLANTPGFFERHAELLGSVQLTSPHGQRAVSLQERQMEMLRDKIRGLEGKIIEMIRFGQDNVLVADKLHRWTEALMLTANAADLPDVLVRGLIDQFMIP